MGFIYKMGAEEELMPLPFPLKNSCQIKILHFLR